MVLALLLDPHYPSDDIFLASIGLLLAWVILVGWSLKQLLPAERSWKRGLLGLVAAGLVLVVGGSLMSWGVLLLALFFS